MLSFVAAYLIKLSGKNINNEASEDFVVNFEIPDSIDIVSVYVLFYYGRSTYGGY